MQLPKDPSSALEVTLSEVGVAGVTRIGTVVLVSALGPSPSFTVSTIRGSTASDLDRLPGLVRLLMFPAAIKAIEAGPTPISFRYVPTATAKTPLAPCG